MRICTDENGEHAITLVPDEAHKLELVRFQEGGIWGLEVRVYSRKDGWLKGCARIESDRGIILRAVAYELLHVADDMSVS